MVKNINADKEALLAEYRAIKAYLGEAVDGMFAPRREFAVATLAA